MLISCCTTLIRIRPSPHGEGGLKLIFYKYFTKNQKSLPTRGGWIETYPYGNTFDETVGPSPHGEGGLKHAGRPPWAELPRPSPHGEGGLKHTWEPVIYPALLSLPTRGGWIETPAD